LSLPLKHSYLDQSKNNSFKMLNKLSLLAVGAALAQLTSAVGNARVKNNCPFAVTAWSVGSDISDPHTLSTGKPQTIYAYNLDGNTVWYDLSDVFGDAFKGHKLKVASADPACPSIVWEDGVPPAGSQVKNCGSGADVTLTLCA